MAQDRKYKTKGSNYKPGNIFDKIGERIASKIIGQDPVTNEIPSQKEKRSGAKIRKKRLEDKLYKGTHLEKDKGLT